MSQHPIPPELAARATAAAAARADFHAEVGRYTRDDAPRPDFQAWAFRLSKELESLLDGLDDAATGAGVAQPGGGWISGGSQS